MVRESGSKYNMKDQFRWVLLTLSGRRLDPEQVTRLLGIRPDSSCRRGDRFGRNKKVVRGYWAIEGCPAGSRLETQARNILRRIEPVKRRFRSLVEHQDVESAYVTFAVMPGGSVAVAGYYLPEDVVSGFSALGVGVEFSIRIPVVFKRAISDYLSRKGTMKQGKG
jgi:hypothetical protein